MRSYGAQYALERGRAAPARRASELDDTTIAGEVAMTDFFAGAVRFDLAADSLVLDRYLGGRRGDRSRTRRQDPRALAISARCQLEGTLRHRARRGLGGVSSTDFVLCRARRLIACARAVLVLVLDALGVATRRPRRSAASACERQSRALSRRLRDLHRRAGRRGVRRARRLRELRPHLERLQGIALPRAQSRRLGRRVHEGAGMHRLLLHDGGARRAARGRAGRARSSRR